MVKTYNLSCPNFLPTKILFNSLEVCVINSFLHVCLEEFSVPMQAYIFNLLSNYKPSVDKILIVYTHIGYIIQYVILITKVFLIIFNWRILSILDYFKKFNFRVFITMRSYIIIILTSYIYIPLSL